MTSVCFVIDHFSCRFHQQGIAYNFLYVIYADGDIVIVHRKTTNPNLGKRCAIWCCCHWGWCLWHLGTVYCWCTKGWKYLLKLKKELKLFLSVSPSTALAGFFLSKYSVSCLKTETGCCPWWLPLAPAEQSIQLFISHTSRLRLCYRLTTRQFLQWKFIYIHIFRQSI